MTNQRSDQRTDRRMDQQTDGQTQVLRCKDAPKIGYKYLLLRHSNNYYTWLQIVYILIVSFWGIWTIKIYLQSLVNDVNILKNSKDKYYERLIFWVNWNISS